MVGTPAVARHSRHAGHRRRRQTGPPGGDAGVRRRIADDPADRLARSTRIWARIVSLTDLARRIWVSGPRRPRSRRSCCSGRWRRSRTPPRGATGAGGGSRSSSRRSTGPTCGCGPATWTRRRWTTTMSSVAGSTSPGCTRRSGPTTSGPTTSSAARVHSSCQRGRVRLRRQRLGTASPSAPGAVLGLDVEARARPDRSVRLNPRPDAGAAGEAVGGVGGDPAPGRRASRTAGPAWHRRRGPEHVVSVA